MEFFLTSLERAELFQCKNWTTGPASLPNCALAKVIIADDDG
jgi:hypothetical protein